MNQQAPEGQVYVCRACGKLSKDLYGKQAIDPGWDVSCTANASLVIKKTIRITSEGLTVAEEATGPCSQNE